MFKRRGYKLRIKSYVKAAAKEIMKLRIISFLVIAHIFHLTKIEVNAFEGSVLWKRRVKKKLLPCWRSRGIASTASPQLTR